MTPHEEIISRLEIMDRKLERILRRLRRNDTTCMMGTWCQRGPDGECTNIHCVNYEAKP